MPQPQLHKLDGGVSRSPKRGDDSSREGHMCHRLLVNGRDVEATDNRRGDATDFRGASLMTDFKMELIFTDVKR